MAFLNIYGHSVKNSSKSKAWSFVNVTNLTNRSLINYSWEIKHESVMLQFSFIFSLGTSVNNRV